MRTFEAKDSFSIHRYPTEASGSLEDYVVLYSHDYQARGDINNKGRNLNGESAPVKGVIILPIPELPNMVSQQKYGQIDGAFNNALATGLGTAYNQIDQSLTNGGTQNMDIGAIAAQLRAQLSDQGGPVVRELAGRVAGSLVGINSGMFQSLAAGEISNPNIELLYSGPTLRSYSFNWTFAPKSREEAQTAYEIVRSLKQAHLPEGASGGGGMLRVPKYFTMKVYVKGKETKFYQKYFPFFIEAISVKQNSAGSGHITLPNGSPAISSMSIVAKEIKTLVAEDFEDNI